MQNKRYTVQLFSLPDDQLCSQFPSSNHRTRRFCWTHRKRPHSRKRQVPAPRPTPIYKPNMTSMVWNISIGQLGLAAWLCYLPAPAHPLIDWTWEIEKSPWFLSKN